MTIRNKKVVELVSAPPIVSEEVFEQSEKELTERRNRSKSEMVNKPLLRALIFCTDCGRVRTSNAPRINLNSSLCSEAYIWKKCSE